MEYINKISSAGQAAAKSAVESAKNLPGTLSAKASNLRKNVIDTSSKINSSMTLYHYAGIMVIILYVVYKYFANKKYYKTNPVLYPEGRNARTEIKMPVDDKMKSMMGKTEYSYTMWLYVDNLDYGFNNYKHIFTRGNTNKFHEVNGKSREGALKIASPGIWFDKVKNNIIVKVSTADASNPETLNPPPVPAVPISSRSVNEFSCVVSQTSASSTVGTGAVAGTIGQSISHSHKLNDKHVPIWGCDCFVIEDYPIRKWFCIGVTIKEREIELYFNGQLTFTGSLAGPVKIPPKNILLNGPGPEITVTAAPLSFPVSVGAASSTKTVPGKDGWAGSIKNIGVYTYALDPIEMKQVYYNGPNNIPYYFKWVYFLFEPIAYLIRTTNRKMVLYSLKALEESSTDLSTVANERASIPAILSAVAGLYKIGQRVFVNDAFGKPMSGYISVGPKADLTNPDTGEVTYDIIVESSESGDVDGTPMTDVKQSLIRSNISVPTSSNRILYSVAAISLIIIITVIYKKNNK